MLNRNRIPLPRLIEALENDQPFIAQALKELAFLDRVSTYSPASAASGLINHWLVERELKCYSRGKVVDDIADLTVCEINGSFDLSMAALEDGLLIDRDELIKLLTKRGFNLPNAFSDEKASLPIDDLPNELGYTVRGAAIAIAREYEVPEQAMRDRLFKAAEKGELPVIDPQTGIPYTPEVRRDFYERIRIDDLNKWFKECGVAYRLEQYVAIDSGNALQSLATGLSRKEILSVDWPLINFSNEALSKAMSDINNAKWLLDAMAMRGKRGPNGSALWNPPMLGVCLIERGYAKKSAITRHIKAHFPDWIIAWEEKAEQL